MPKIVTKKTRFPEGWEVVKDTLDEFERKMREALADPHEGKRKVESVWPIMKINHQRSRYIYEKYYHTHEITKEVYDFCLKQGYADASLIAKWKKTGYEKLCCLKCIQTRDSNTGGTCICRVPKSKLESGTIVQCTNCGCRGCASCDV
ncbi:bud site selection protein 31 [Monocercomonoides exilis]|uniref:bud site selection protein 31 n=1 Tax=Monocercomonoides exilis TaxID=2049356 RepID=UPI00355A8FDE|nr:bud site selection protein 31 [Monocercomonoides exilis]